MMSTDSPLLAYLLNNEPSFRKARLAALYSDFTSLRTLNPDGYNANITAWSKGLSHAGRAGFLPLNDSLILSLNSELYQDLQTKEWGKPLALGTVVEEAVKARQMVVLGPFLESKESIFRSRWHVPSIGEILGWGLKQFGLDFGAGITDTGRLVLLENLEVAGRNFEAVTQAQKSRIERIYSLRSFKESHRDLLGPSTSLSDTDFDVLLRYLQRDKGIISWAGDTIKIRASGEGEGITSEDASIASLKTLIADLNIQTKLLEKKVDELNITAQQAVKKKNRVSALAALRSKKLAEGTLVKRHGTLAQLEEVFASIEQAADQVALVRVMEGSAQVLKGLNKEVGGVERVDDVVQSLRESMGQVDEVGNVIAEAGSSEVDEGEVDDELEVLEREEKTKMEEIERKGREERERREAEETRQKLDALGEAERLAREKQVEKVSEKGSDKIERSEKALDDNVEGLKRISLDPPEKVSA